MSAIDAEVCKQKVEEGGEDDAQRERTHSTIGEDLDMAGPVFSCGAIGYGPSWSANRTPKLAGGAGESGSIRLMIRSSRLFTMTGA